MQRTNYQVTFSASRWPSLEADILHKFQIFMLQLFHCENMTAEECQDYYRLNAAMVEVFYETLNHEVIQESEAYGFVNLVADFGGHLGLWLGRTSACIPFSVITMIEVIVLLVETDINVLPSKS
ncbi:hypothetical protein COOONC_26152 [Cooperia oncophora]